jgi:hypothetical protein
MPAGHGPARKRLPASDKRRMNDMATAGSAAVRDTRARWKGRPTMKPVSAALHATALLACFAAHFAFAEELSGIRRALQTMGTVQTAVVQEPMPTSAVVLQRQKA